MNESVYKSPKWLKKYFDYELTTGDDIAGRREERERIERQRESERQKEIDKENVAKKLKAQIEKELADLYQHIINDFSGSPYIDKIHTTKEGGEVALNYTFENGDKLKICGDEITYGGSIYTVGLLWRNKFIGLGNEMIDKATKRSSGKSTPKSSTTSGNKYSSHPKGNLYQTLKDTVKQREAQLSKMKKGDPDRSSMENELDAAKKEAKRNER